MTLCATLRVWWNWGCLRVARLLLGSALAAGGLDHFAHGFPNFGIMATEEITRRRIAPRRADCLHHGLSRLDALGLLKLPQIIPCCKQDKPVGIDHNHAPDIAVIALAAASVISGGTSVTMILTSTGIAQKRL
jgi:hypothetical protein